MANQTIVFNANGFSKSLNKFKDSIVAQGYKTSTESHKNATLSNKDSFLIMEHNVIPVGGGHETIDIPKCIIEVYTYVYPVYKTKYRVVKSKNTKEQEFGYYDDTIAEKLGGNEEILGG